MFLETFTFQVILYTFYLNFQGTGLNFDVDHLPLAPDVLNTWAHLISTASADFRGPKRRRRLSSTDDLNEYGKALQNNNTVIYCFCAIYYYSTS